MLHAWCVFVAGIHPSRTWMSGSFESVQWNAHVHRLDLGLHFHPKEYFREWNQNPFYLQGKNPLYRRLRGGLKPRCYIRQDREPKTLPTEPLRPLAIAQPDMMAFFWAATCPNDTPSVYQAGQGAQDTTD